MKPHVTPMTRNKAVVLGAFAAGVVTAVPAGFPIPGILLLAVSLWAARRDPDPKLAPRMAVLAVVVAVLGFTDINTDLSNRNFLTVGGAFLFAVAFPAFMLRKNREVITYRFIPLRFRWRDVIYVVISVPLAWAVLKVYFSLNPWMPTHWTLPPEQDMEQVWRLFAGINMVGIWDELFFVNTVYGVLRTLFPYRWANAGQTVVYASVLYDMAFTGWGILIVPAFAWTQGAMFESSEGLLGVLIVHLIVDFFLFAAIVQFYYPGFTLGWH